MTNLLRATKMALNMRMYGCGINKPAGWRWVHYADY